MFEAGDRIEMTKGYRGISGTVAETTNSAYEFYVVALDNGINIVVGPSAFVPENTESDGQT